MLDDQDLAISTGVIVADTAESGASQAAIEVADAELRVCRVCAGFDLLVEEEPTARRVSGKQTSFPTFLAKLAEERFPKR